MGDEPIAAAPTTATPATERTEWWHDSNTWGRDTRPWWQRNWWYGYGGWDWQNSQPSSSGSSVASQRDANTEILPDVIQGWFLLQDAGLEVHERNLVQTALQGDFSLQRVAQELRNQWPEAELRKRDQAHRQSGFMGVEASDDDDGQRDPDLDESSLLASGMGEEGLALIAQAEQTAQEAMAAIQQGRRTLREARAKQKEVRISRKYYQASNRFKDKRSSAHMVRDDSQMTCLRCGQIGHRAANCPERDRSKSAGGNAHMADAEARTRTPRPWRRA